MLDPGTHEYSVFAGIIIADSYYHTQRRRTVTGVYVIDVGRRPDVSPTAAPIEDGPGNEWKADRIEDYLSEHGPSTINEVMAGTKLKEHSVRKYLNEDDRFGHNGKRPYMWDIVS